MKKKAQRKSTHNHGSRTRSLLGAVVLLVVIFCGGLGLTHILVKNKTHAIARQQRMVEQEIISLQQQIRSVDAKIEEALSRKNITDKLVSRRSKLKTILPGNVIRVSVPTVASAPPASAQ